jgi:hypothetical protein
MNAAVARRLASWWLQGARALGRVQPLTSDAWLAAIVTRVLRGAQVWLQRLGHADREPQTAEELLAYACRIERDMPGLAADLRCAALRHEAATTP